MEKVSADSLDFFLKRAGLEVPEGDMRSLRPLIERYLESLKVLHSINLLDEEVAPCFQPAPDTE